MKSERRNRSKNSRDFARDLRQNQNLVESLLWEELRNGKLNGYKFRRQFPIGRYIVDFYRAAAKLAIELDGETHRGKEVQDAERQAWLEAQGLLLLRCGNEEVYDSLDTILEAIFRHCESRSQRG